MSELVLTIIHDEDDEDIGAVIPVLAQEEDISTYLYEAMESRGDLNSVTRL